MIILLCLSSLAISAQDEDKLDFLEEEDANILKSSNEKAASESSSLNVADLEEVEDLSETLFKSERSQSTNNHQMATSTTGVGGVEQEAITGEVVNSRKAINSRDKVQIFDVGDEEKVLLDISKYIEGKIPASEWNDIAAGAIKEKYVVQEGDWLWKISKKLFGTGFYYSKIWSLNPQIQNPHEIEPGMVLVFDTGTLEDIPRVAIGSFADPSDTEVQTDADGKKIESVQKYFNLEAFGEGVRPTWLNERDQLKKQGLYFQYASEETYEDLSILARKALNTEYTKYEPPISTIIIREPGDEYDATGFDKNSKINFNFKQGFYLNTFGSTNIVQDIGFIDATADAALFIHKHQMVFVSLDSTVKAKPGDLFSVYSAEGNLKHTISDRTGYRYTILAQIRLIRKINEKWEAEVFDLAGLVQRNDRITIYTPKINQLVQTYNKRNIEAVMIDSYRPNIGSVTYGDVVYLDRGRADGVELGTVFEVYSFTDKGTGKKITPDPTYKIGELTVITITDDFSTALVTNSSDVISIGSLAISKSVEDAARANRKKGKGLLAGIGKIENLALDELDVELNLDDLGDDLLKKADKIKLSEDELEELERQERDKSIIKDHEKDLKELERLESELVNAEALLNESKLDEDRFLEQHNLNSLEKQGKVADPDAFKSLNEIEKDIGKKYMDQDLNAKDNPYGLTEFDLEEVDQLLNTDAR